MCNHMSLSSHDCSAQKEVHSNYTLITGQTKCMLFYVKGNVSANFASQTRNRNIMGREPSFETIEIRGPTHSQPARTAT